MEFLKLYVLSMILLSLLLQQECQQIFNKLHEIGFLSLIICAILHIASNVC